jgi:hypothetical protein
MAAGGHLARMPRMSELVIVFALVAGAGLAPEPLRWFGKIAVTTGLPAGALTLRSVKTASGPIAVEVAPAPPAKTTPKKVAPKK